MSKPAMKLHPEISGYLATVGAKGGANGKGVPKKRVSEYMAKLGKKGGKNGAGKSKTRSPAHYKRMAAVRARNTERR